MSLSFKFVGPVATSTAHLRGEFMNAGKWTARYMLRLLEKYVSVFEEISPSFKEHATYAGGDVFAVIELAGGLAGGGNVTAIGPQGQRKGVRNVGSNQIFMWLNNGTSVRHAKVGKRFSRKTAPNSMQSTGGRDDIEYVRKTYRGKGIQPRNVLQLVGEEGMKELGRRVDKIIASIKI